MNSLEKVEPNKGAIGQVREYSQKLISTLRNSLYAGAKDESIEMVVDYCREASLDVMLKPVHIVPMWVVDRTTNKGEMRDTIMPGINLYRIQASRSGCAGISEPEFGEDIKECLGGVDITYPKWCRVTVKRLIGGKVFEWTAKELWKENYATAGKDKQTGVASMAPNTMWKKRPYGQIAKCAEAQALRKAFPEIGALPTAEEMEGKHLDTEAFAEIEKSKTTIGKGVKGLSARFGIEEETTAVDFDNTTGEVVDAEVTEIETTAVQGQASEGEKMSLDTLIFLIESAADMKELMDAMKHLKELPPADKNKAFAIYKTVEAKLKV